MSVFGDYARYYNLFYQDKDYEGEAEFVHTLLGRHAPGSRRVLEFGSGTGRHAALLAGKGYRVHGVERSETMLKQAKDLAASAPPKIRELLSFEKQAIQHFDSGERFDAVISLFHVFSYQTSDAELDAAFGSAVRHLEPGGVLLFDCWYGPTVLHELPSVRVKHLEDEAVRVTRISEPTLHADRNCVEVTYTVFVEDKRTGEIRRVNEERHVMRYLFSPEVEARLRSAGLTPVASGEWMTDRRPGVDTFGVYFVGKKTP